MSNKVNYGKALLEGFEYLLSNHADVFVIGQGLWSPWYVGSSMTDLDKKFGKDRVIDTPVSELACTGAAVGASLAGYKPIVVHPRIDFMLLAVDQIVSQAAKWHHMLGGSATASVTIRGIINRGGEQGAQHSQALHAWFAHIPGLRVVMPATPGDARDLLISSVLCDSPVVFIDDRWLYEQEDELSDIDPVPLESIRPKILKDGEDITLVGCSYSTYLCTQAAEALETQDVSAEVIDLRVLNPFYSDVVVKSVDKTGRLLVVDGGWPNCGMSSQVIATVAERADLSGFRCRPRRITIPEAPAPTSQALEKIYYPTSETVIRCATEMIMR